MEADYNKCQGRMSDKLPGFLDCKLLKASGAPKGKNGKQAERAFASRLPACNTHI